MKPFGILYTIVVLVGSVIAFVPAAFYLLLFATAGLGLPLLVAPTAAIYLTGLWPSIFLWEWTRRVLPSVTLAISSLALVAVGPGFVAREIAERDAGAAKSADADEVFQPPDSRVRLLQYQKADPENARSTSSFATCLPLCQLLLVRKDVEAIEVTGVASDKRKTDVVTYRRTLQRPCPALRIEPQWLLPETKSAERDGLCIVASPNTIGETGRVRIDQYGSFWRSSSKIFHIPEYTNVVEVKVLQGGNWKTTLRGKIYRTRVLSIPLAFALPDSQGMTSPSFSRETREFGFNSEYEMVRAALGIQ
jgi:hypothetical protein